MSRTQLARSAAATLIAASVVAFGPVAASSAAVSDRTTEVHAADAASDPTLYAGVRQAAVGEEFPVAVVGAAEGSVWEIRVAEGEEPAASATVGADGTGTALVRVPVGTAGGAIPVTAVSGGRELSTTVSVAGDPGEDAGASAVGAADAAAADSAQEIPVGTVVLAGAGVLVLAGAAVAVPIAIRRRGGRAAA